MKILSLILSTGKMAKNELIMYILKKLVGWIFSEENIRKLKEYVKTTIKEKAAKEGVDVWDYLNELLMPIFEKDFESLEAYVKKLATKEAEKDSANDLWKLVKELML